MKKKPVVEKNTGPVITPAKRSLNWDLFLLAGLIAFVTFVSFSPALKNYFINWDDNAYVFENRHLAKPVPNATAYFFDAHYFIGNYIPLTMFTYVLEYHVAGLKPYLYHLVNIIFHLLNVLLVFWFIYLLSGKKPLVASLVSLFFGIHPMHVESVAWIAELKDVQYSFFFIAGLICYYKYLESKNENLKTREQPSFLKKNVYRFLFPAFIFFVLSTLSKPAAVIFPLVLLLLDFYTHRKPDKWLWLEKLPFFIISLVFGIIAIKSQQADRLINDDYAFYQRLLFASHSTLAYIAKLFLPLNLSIFYPYPPILNGYLPVIYYLAPILLILVCYAVYRTLKYTRLIAFGFLFFFVNVILVLQLLSVGEAVMAERYTYIAYIGLFFVLAMGFHRFWHDKEHNSRIFKPAAGILAAVLIIGCSYLTHARCRVWKNELSIASDLLLKFPDDWLALNNKGFILSQQKMNEEAVTLFNKAIQKKPDYSMAYINLINTYQTMGNYDKAMETAEKALVRLPRDHHLLNKKGNLLFIKSEYEEAKQYYKEAISLKKDNIWGYLNLCEYYYVKKDYANGIKTLDTAMKYLPDDFILLNNKGYFLFLLHQYSEAVEYFKASLKINPGYTTASVNLADCNKALIDSVGVKNK